MPYKDNEKNKACKRRFNQSEEGKAYKHGWYVKNKNRAIASVFKKKYGISLSDYEALLERQNGVCAICRRTCKSGRNLAVDHCHETGKVRGLLCLECNRGIGALKDSIDLLTKAISYLKDNGIIEPEVAYGA